MLFSLLLLFATPVSEDTPATDKSATEPTATEKSPAAAAKSVQPVEQPNPESPTLLSPITRALSLRPQTAVLENGLTVVLHEDHRSPIINLTTLVRVGSADDPPDASGLAHLFEHLMFKGSPNAPGADWGRLLEEAGAESKAWTERDWTIYQTTGPSSSLERLLFLESDRLGWMPESLSDDIIQKERLVIDNERAARKGGDDSALFSTLHQLLWPEGHPYHRPVLGLDDHQESLTIGHIVQLFGSHYRPSNAIVVITGDFERSATLELAKAHFGLIENRGARALRPYADSPRRDNDVRIKWVVSGGAPLLSLGWNTPPWGHPDLPKLRLAAEILRARCNALPHVAYNAPPKVALRSRRAGGELVFQLVSDGSDLDTLLKAFDAQLNDLAMNGPSQTELDHARMRWQAKSLEALEDLDSIGLALARCSAVHEEADCTGPEMAAVEQVTPQQVQAAIRTHLQQNRVLLSRVSEKQADLALENAEDYQ